MARSALSRTMVRTAWQRRCRSSVVEHLIGNEEVDSSILSGSTSQRQRPATLFPYIRIFVGCARLDRRSEEHTSELQSLMRISSAVFCLHKKIHRTTAELRHKPPDRTHPLTHP